MIDIEEITRLYFERTGRPGDEYDRDVTYHAQTDWLVDMITQLGVILEDEGIPDETAARIVRGVLYGAPTAEAARERMRHNQAMTEQAMRTPFRMEVSGDAMRKWFGD